MDLRIEAKVHAHTFPYAVFCYALSLSMLSIALIYIIWIGLIVSDAMKDVNNLRNFICNEFGYPYLCILEGRSMGGMVKWVAIFFHFLTNVTYKTGRLCTFLCRFLFCKTLFLCYYLNIWYIFLTSFLLHLDCDPFGRTRKRRVDVSRCTCHWSRAASERESSALASATLSQDPLPISDQHIRNGTDWIIPERMSTSASQRLEHHSASHLGC